MADTKITLLNEGTVVSLLDWLVAVDVSYTGGGGAMGVDGTDVKWKVQTLVDFFKTQMVPIYQGINPQTGNYTAALIDITYIVTVDSAIDVNFTLPQYATIPFPNGSWLEVIQLGVGKVNFVPEGGIASYKTRTQGSRMKAQTLAIDTWHISGDLVTV